MPFSIYGHLLSKYVSKNAFKKQFIFIASRMMNNLSFNKELDLLLKTEIENKWSGELRKGCFDPDKDDKFYVLSMFPYPSGNLHMGHVRVYTISDALSRFHRLNGRNVLQPMGFDAFGLPAENAALKNNVDPEKWTYDNISSMKTELCSLGFSFDWDREIITCSEDYYKFTQFIFLLLYKEGLVYQKEDLVNWDPVDKTVLADEQVDSFGKSWRSGASVEKKLLKQWFIKTTRFARDLLKGLDDPMLKDWRDIIKLQKHWIGDCDGSRFDFDVIVNEEAKEKIPIWINYPEHITQAAFVVASPSSILGLKYSSQKIQVLNPFNKTKIPVFITNELNFDEGCDIKLGIPSLYEEDRPFADKHGISYEKTELCYDSELRHRVCESGLSSGIGGYSVSSKLRDWLISRQRKWGTPIPVVHCGSCGPVPVDTQDLPVKLSDPTDTTCPKCKGRAKRETDTMDTFVDSSWYFLRYTDPHNTSLPFSTDKANELMPVDVYVGGKEHAVLHLYYSRFISHFLHSMDLLKEREPFRRLLVQGMVMGRTYYIKETGECIPKERVSKEDNRFIDNTSQKEVEEVWEKMSKSKYNGVEPATIVAEYGLDTSRLLVLAEVAPQSHRNWDADKFAGVLKWQNRLWSLMADFLEVRKSGERALTLPPSKEPDLWDARNYYIKGTSFNYEVSHQLSIVISKLQGLTNTLKKCDKHVMLKNPSFERCLGELIVMLFPLAPHFASELWEGLQSAPNRIDSKGIYFQWNQSVSFQSWPQLDKEYRLELVCKVNNAVKASVQLPVEKFVELTKSEALQIALSQKKVVSFLKSREVLDYDLNILKNYEATINLKVEPPRKQSSEKRSNEDIQHAQGSV